MYAQAPISHASCAQLEDARCASGKAHYIQYLEIASGHVVPSELNVSQSDGLLAQTSLAASQGMLQTC